MSDVSGIPRQVHSTTTLGTTSFRGGPVALLSISIAFVISLGNLIYLNFYSGRVIFYYNSFYNFLIVDTSALLASASSICIFLICFIFVYRNLSGRGSRP